MLGFLGFLAILVLFIMLADTRARLKRAEATLQEAAKRIGALQRQAGLLPPKEGEAPPAAAVPVPEAPPPASPWTPPSAETLERWKPRTEAEDAAPETKPEPEPVAAASAPLPAISAEPPVDDAPEPLAAQTAPTPHAPAEPPRNMASRFEDLFGKTLPIWAGGITLAIAGVLIVRYAIDAGFFARIFTPGVQIVAGLLFGLGLIFAAEFAWRNEDKVRDLRVPQALSGAGIATLYAAILVAANVYQLIGPALAFAGLAAVTAAALGLSLRFGPPSALLGLAGGLAAPALVGAVAPNVPLLAVYLALTIAGLTGVSRRRRWPWLALAALVGGAGWGLWMMLANQTLDALGSLSIGGFVLLLAIALPLFAFDGPRATLLRTASAIVGALQLALLVAFGGFTLLNWGLFILLAAAAQWLAWRERGFAIVPTISLALSVLLLAAWPDPAPRWLAIIGLSLAAIHALPLLARLWSDGRALRRALELCAIALVAAPLVKWHVWNISDTGLAMVALGGAVLVGAGIARGWRVEGRAADSRFAWLTGTTGILLTAAILLIVPHWTAPLGVALVTAGLLFFGKAAKDGRIEPIAASFAGLALLVLAASPLALDEWPRLIWGAEGADGHALLRWAGITALFALFAVRADGKWLRIAAAVLAAALAYGTLAQAVSGTWLMLVPAIGGAATLIAARRIALDRTGAAAASFAAITLAWAVLPVGIWGAKAGLSLVGLPMVIDTPALAADQLLLRLAIPAMLFAAPLWLLRARLPRWLLLGGLAVSGLLGGIAVHSLYRLGFAGLAGGDFVATGIVQRLVWEALLIGGGWLAMTRGLTGLARPLVLAGTTHAIFYGLILHNPLWAAQAVGGWPVGNLLIPLFLLPWLGLAIIQRLFASAAALFDRAIQIAAMLLLLGFAWATLRHAFHGSLLVDPGVAPAENILRSILILALAIAFLLWGIRARRHDWRIASLVLMLGAVGKVFLFDASGLEGLLRIGSFVALGFSLIGIGWLYSRQLASGADTGDKAAA